MVSLNWRAKGSAFNSRPNVFNKWKCISNILSKTIELPKSEPESFRFCLVFVFFWANPIMQCRTKVLFDMVLNNDQALTITRFPTRPKLFLLPEPDPNSFSKFPRVFPMLLQIFQQLFPGYFKSFNNYPQILLFSSPPDMKFSVSNVKCLWYKKFGKFDNWFMVHFDLFSSSQDSQINQPKRRQFSFRSPWSQAASSCTSPATRGPPPSKDSTWPSLGWPHCRRRKPPAQILMKQLALVRPPWRAGQEGETETRDASTIPARP